MGLESPGYVSDLVSSNPTGTDFESQGDDHLRLIKGNLQTTFPNAARIFRFHDTKVAQTTTYSISETADLHKIIVCDGESAGFTVNLPNTTIDGWHCWIQKRDASSNLITIDPVGSQGINDQLTQTLSKQYQLALCWWDQTNGNWIFAQIFPSTPYYSGAQDIPFSDIAQIGTAKRLLGSATAPADVGEVDIATVFEWLGTAARGDIILRGASAFAYKNLGTSGTFLKSDGTDLVYGLPLVPAYTATSYATSTALSIAIPYDDTIPQIGEGTEILTLSITPIKSTSIIRVSFTGQYLLHSGGRATVALFKDGSANAVRAVVGTTSAVDLENNFSLEYSFSPGSTSAITLAIRAGASSGSLYMNGNSSSRQLGGASAATLIAQEIFVT